MSSLDTKTLQHLQDHIKEYTYDMFMMNLSSEPEEVELFSSWLNLLNQKQLNSFEAVRSSAQTTEVEIIRQGGDHCKVLNLSSYNYLGFGYHPEVIKAAQNAVAIYGLGAASSPVISGTYNIHKQFENALIKFFDLPNRGVSLFSSGYAVNLGVLQAFMKPGSHILLDEAAHMSLVEGAKLSGAKASYFKHNDMSHLESLLQLVSNEFTRVLICSEGIYSGDGDEGNLRQIVKLAKQYKAFTLVDEAHSVLLAGKNGRGVAEAQGVLSDIDLYIMTFSKAFAGVGGALLASKAMVQYVNWYAKCRMFSCALDPAVTGGMIKVLELASGPEGHNRREKLKKNVIFLKKLLKEKVDLGISDSWILTVIYGEDKKTIDISSYLQRSGLDTSIMQFPAAPKNKGRIRLFITSEHSHEQLRKAADIILQAAKEFDFLITQ